MRKLLFSIIASLAVWPALSDVVRVPAPTHNQVAGVSNQVMAVDAKLTATALDVEAVKGLVVGNEAASPYLGGVRLIFNTSPTAHEPQGAEYYKALAGAYIEIKAPKDVYRVGVDNIHSGAVKQVFIPCDSAVDVRVQLHLGPADHLYSAGEQTVHVRQGEIVDVNVDTVAPINPARGEEETYRMIGRAQYYDPANANGKQSTGESFPIQRIYDADANAWVTQFGFYSNSVWVTQCDIYSLVPQLDDTGACVNADAIGDLSASYEASAFPWCESKRVIVEVATNMFSSAAHANNATNLFYFSRVPIYAYKETVETLTITNLTANGTVSSVASYPMQIHWVARPSITNGIDNTFSIPSWEKVYKRVKDEETGTWSTVCLGVKEANYYASYKTAPTYTSSDSWKLWRGPSAKRVTQSFPYPNRDSSNNGVAALTRAEMHTASTNLNPFALKMYEVANGTERGRLMASIPAPTGDMALRRWHGNTWHDYRAFQELAYIQFSANAQSTANVVCNDGKGHPIGIYGNNNTSVLSTRQDALEYCYSQQTNLITFSIGPQTANGGAFSWLGILNFWGSEGDQMADVTTVRQTDADGTQATWYLANLDHTRLVADTSGSTSSYATFTDTYGYEQLDYFWSYTGLSGSYYRGKDARDEYAAFPLVRTTPTTANALFSVNLNSSPYDGYYAPSSWPAKPDSGSSFSYWMCSLSHYRSNALGPWFVCSCYGPSHSYALYWGGRASISFLGAECEAWSASE